MHFSVLPPEINSLRMFTGAGSGPMWVAAVAWEGLAGESWQGAASAPMTSIAIPYAGWLNTAAAQAAEAAAQAKTVVSAFEAAQAAMVHPLAVAANRNQFVQLVSSNLFGQNAPA